MPKQLYNVINIINQSLQLKKVKIELPYSKVTFNFISTIYNQNYLESFQLRNQQIICFFKKNQGQFVFEQIKLPVKKGQKKHLKVSSLWSNGSSGFSCAIYSTSKGLLSEKTCMKVNACGKFYCIII
jgi:ribosomal protein S8